MNVAGAIHAAGSRPLKDFHWGIIIVNIINSSMDTDEPITLDTTGKMIISMLDKIPDKEKNLILGYPIAEVDEEGDFHIDRPSRERSDPKLILIIAFSMIMVIIAGVTTLSQTSPHLDSTGKADYSQMNFIFSTLADIIKTYLSK